MLLNMFIFKFCNISDFYPFFQNMSFKCSKSFADFNHKNLQIYKNFNHISIFNEILIVGQAWILNQISIIEKTIFYQTSIFEKKFLTKFRF